MHDLIANYLFALAAICGLLALVATDSTEE
jgi:hypothetical protein